MFALYEQHRGTIGPVQFLDLLIDEGVPRRQIEAAMRCDPDGRGALGDRMTADMANRVLSDLGVSPTQTPADVKRLRETGGAGASTSRPEGDARPPRTR